MFNVDVSTMAAPKTLHKQHVVKLLAKQNHQVLQKSLTYTDQYLSFNVILLLEE